jgi:hypothetical protein
MTADLAGLHDVEKLARAGPDQFDMGMVANAQESAAENRKRVAAGVGDASGEDRDTGRRTVPEAGNNGVHLLKRHYRGNIHLHALTRQPVHQRRGA